jgi:hypothetical protein
MEIMLKFILTITNFSVPISKMQTHLETQAKHLHNQPMGRLVESAAKALHSKPLSAPSDINEAWISHSFNLSDGGSHLPDWRREMQHVVRERNTLIHQMLSSWDANSLDSCHALCEKLDAQRESIINAYAHLESIVKTIRESHKELALEADEIVRRDDDESINA